MKKTTKTAKTPAPATKTATPAPASKAAAPKIPAPSAGSKPPAAEVPPAAAPKAKKPASPAPSLLKPKVAAVTITAKIDVGFGNALYLRGSGAGLSWDRGMPLACIEGDTWRVVLPAADKAFAFKFVLNDERWSAGDDYLAGPGDTVTVTPAF